MRKFKHIILGGTFDHFHKGHIAFLDFALKQADRLSIGIAKENLYKGKVLWQSIESYRIREKSVQDYLAKKKSIDRAKLIPITTVYGTSLTDTSIEAIIATKQTISGAKKVNEARKMKNLRPLKIILAPFVRDETGEIISSERIRAGEIDRSGYVYANFFREGRKLTLPDNLREKLRVPLGQVIKGGEEDLLPAARKTLALVKKIKPTMVIAVGDIIVISLLKLGFNPDISIIDLRSRRKELVSHEQNFLGTKHVEQMKRFKEMVPQNFIHLETPKNEPGTINPESVNAVNESLKKYFQTEEKKLMIIKGEEDLLTLPAILLAPLGSVVCYGQWNLGIVVVMVTEEVKKKIEKICKRFIVVR